MNVVVAQFEDGSHMVGFDLGLKEHNGVAYRLVSAYTDGRPAHWLSGDTALVDLGKWSE